MPPQIPISVLHTLDNGREVLVDCESGFCRGTYLDEDNQRVALICGLLPRGHLNCPKTPSAPAPPRTTVRGDTEPPPPPPLDLGKAGTTEDKSSPPSPTTTQPTPPLRSMPPPSPQELEEQRTFFRKYWHRLFPSGFSGSKQTMMSPPDTASQAQVVVAADPYLPESKCGTWGFFRTWVVRTFLKNIQDKIFAPGLFQSDVGSMWSAEGAKLFKLAQEEAPADQALGDT